MFSHKLESLKQLIHRNVLVFDYFQYDILQGCYELAFPHRNSSLKDYCQLPLVDAIKHDTIKQLLTGMTYLGERGIHSIHLDPEEIHMYSTDHPHPELRLSFNIETNILNEGSSPHVDFTKQYNQDILYTLVGFILTGKDASDDTELELLRDVKMEILMLALKKGLPIADALNSPAFHSNSEKMNTVL